MQENMKNILVSIKHEEKNLWSGVLLSQLCLKSNFFIQNNIQQN